MIYDININNYADDKTPFLSGGTAVNVLTSLKNADENFFEWFTNNHMKANYDKYHLLMNTLTAISIKIKDYIVKKPIENLLCAKVDANLIISIVT